MTADLADAASCHFFQETVDVLSFPTLKANEACFGFGFVVAAALGMALAAWRANGRVSQLESYIFRAQ